MNYLRSPLLIVTPSNKSNTQKKPVHKILSHMQHIHMYIINNI